METMDKAYFERRRKELDSAFNAIKSDWQELADYFMPRSVRFLVRNVNKKMEKNKKIKDSAPLKAVRNFSSGMMSGATNPATNWFRIKVKSLNNDNPLNDDLSVRQWCGSVENLFKTILNSSNFYSLLPTTYKQLGVFGISAISLESSADSILNAKLLPIGSYRIAKDSTGKIDTICRVFMETAKNLYERFGEDNVSSTVKTAVQSKQYEQMFEIIHFVCPNADYIPNSPWAKNKKFISVYYEATTGEKNKFLSKSGFDKFPYIVFQAEVNGEDVYPSDFPAINALPDVKQLMAEIVDKGKTIKKVISPPLKGPANLKNKKLTDNPATFTETNDTGEGLSPVLQVPPQVLVPLKQDIDELRQSIYECFYNDLFAMILNTAERSRTATEVNELKEEKMVLLSPLLEQIHDGLSQLMDWLFSECINRGVISSIPPQIQGGELDIQFVSMLAQAQQGQKISAMERFTTFTANMAQATGDAILVKKLNTEKIIDDYADFVNINPSQLNSNDNLKKLRQLQAEKQEQIEQIEQAKQGTEIYKNIAGADAYGGELMSRLGMN